MKTVGILCGREVTFPDALISNLNQRGKGEVLAEYVTVGGVRLHDSKPYDLILDRISHQVPFYRAFLKKAALDGSIVINNPFWWTADDKFLNYNLAAKLGVAVPKTVLLPQHAYIDDISRESLRNLEFPIKWEELLEYTGTPAYLKPFDGGGWKNVSRITSLHELWSEYNKSGTLCMVLQEGIEFEQFVRCYCVGQKDVLIMPYDPSKPYLSGEQYVVNENYLAPTLRERVVNDVVALNLALGYDLNTVEFAIKDGIPYAIDFMNPAPDAELASVGAYYHNWITEAMTKFILASLEIPESTITYRWDALLNPKPIKGTPGKITSSSKKQSTRARAVRAVKTEKAAQATDPPKRKASVRKAAGATGSAAS